MKKRIVILGGGFAGVKGAQTLVRELPRDEHEVVLFNLENHLVFTPLLADVIGSSLNPLDAIVPLRHLLPGVLCRTEEVTSIDPARNEICYETSDGQAARIEYEHLVLACGSVANLNAVPGMADHAFPLKNIGDAVALRSHLMEQMENAETCANEERRRWYLSFVVVGGGYSGVEAAGEINDLIRSSARYFRNFRAEDVTVTLIHSRPELLPEIGPSLRQFARQEMEKAGVKVLVNTMVTSAAAEGVTLAEGSFIKAGTVVCTVGNSPSPLVERLAAAKVHGRLKTDSDMRVSGFSNLWATGDCAQIINASTGQPSPPTGQLAERQGRQCAENIARVLRGEPTEPFRFKPLGQLCAIGGHSAVAEIFGLQLSGFFAWFLWRGIYLFKLPTWGRRCQVGFDWAWLLLFPRDLAHIRAKQTDRVSHAHYRPGDFIIKQGELSERFYVVENGEVEIVYSPANNHSGEITNVLGPGSFFGEKALVSQEPLGYSVRARTAVKVLVMGRNVFTQISASLAPLRDAVAETLNRRSVDPWKMHPEVFESLKGVSIQDLMEEIPEPVFGMTSRLGDVGRAFAEHPHEVYFICDEGGELRGVVTMTDWMTALSRGATGDTPVSEFMVSEPMALSESDDAALAAGVIREYRLKNLPVVRSRDDKHLVGRLRTRRLMGLVFAHMAGRPGQQTAPAPQAANVLQSVH